MSDVLSPPDDDSSFGFRISDDELHRMISDGLETYFNEHPVIFTDEIADSIIALLMIVVAR